jgi:hypothetical protein
MDFTPWPKEKAKLVEKQYNIGVPLAEIAANAGVNMGALRAKLQRMGIQREGPASPKYQTPKGNDVEFLRLLRKHHPNRAPGNRAEQDDGVML